MKATLSFLSAAVALASTAVAQDECATAMNMAVGVPTPFSTLTATESAPDFSCAAGGGSLTSPDVWLEFTALTTTNATASTCNTADYDTKIEIYSGGCLALTSVARNDDGTGCAGFTSEVTFPVVAGVQYLSLIHI